MLRPIVGEQLIARGFRGAAIFAPEIQIPLKAEPEFGVAGVVGPKNFDCGSSGAVARSDRRGGGKLVAARDGQLSLRLQDARGGDAHVVVLFEALCGSASEVAGLEIRPAISHLRTKR